MSTAGVLFLLFVGGWGGWTAHCRWLIFRQRRNPAPSPVDRDLVEQARAKLGRSVLDLRATPFQVNRDAGKLLDQALGPAPARPSLLARWWRSRGHQR